MSISRDCTQASFEEAHQTLGELSDAVTAEYKASRKTGLSGFFGRMFRRGPAPCCSREKLNQAMAFLQSYQAHTGKVGARTLKKIAVASDAAMLSQQDVTQATTNGVLHHRTPNSTKGVRKAIKKIQKDLKAESKSFEKAKTLISQMEINNVSVLDTNLKQLMKLAAKSKLGDVKFLSSLPKEHAEKLLDIFVKYNLTGTLGTVKPAFLKMFLKQCPDKLGETHLIRDHFVQDGIIEKMHLSDRLKASLLELCAKGKSVAFQPYHKEMYEKVQADVMKSGMGEKLNNLEESIESFLSASGDLNSHKELKSFKCFIIAKALSGPDECKRCLSHIDHLISQAPDSPQKDQMKEILAEVKKDLIRNRLKSTFGKKLIEKNWDTFQFYPTILSDFIRDTGISLKEVLDLSSGRVKENVTRSISALLIPGEYLEDYIHERQNQSQKALLKEALILAIEQGDPEKLFGNIHSFHEALYAVTVGSNGIEETPLSFLDDPRLSDEGRVRIILTLDKIRPKKSEFAKKLRSSQVQLIRKSVNSYVKKSPLFDRKSLSAKLSAGNKAFTKGELLIIESHIERGELEVLRRLVEIADSQNDIKNPTDLTESFYTAISSHKDEEAQLKAMVEVLSAQIKPGLIYSYSAQAKRHIDQMILGKSLSGNQADAFREQFNKLFPQACRISQKITEVKNPKISDDLKLAGETFVARQARADFLAQGGDLDDDPMLKETIEEAKIAYRNGSETDPNISLDDSMEKKQVVKQMRDYITADMLKERISPARFLEMPQSELSFYVKALEDRGVSIDEPLTKSGKTLLQLVVMSGNEELTNYLLKKMEQSESQLLSKGIRSLVLQGSLYADNPAKAVLRKHVIRKDIENYVDYIGSIAGDPIMMEEPSPALNFLPEGKRESVVQRLNEIKDQFETMQTEFESKDISPEEYRKASGKLRRELSSILSLIQQRSDLEFGMDGRGALLPQKPQQLFPISKHQVQHDKLAEANDDFKIPDAPPGHSLSEMEKIIKLAEYQMPKIFNDEGSDKSTSEIMRTYRSALNMGGVRDHYNKSWSPELKGFFKKIHLHYIAKMTPKIKKMEAIKDPDKKEKAKKELASEIRGFVLDRMGGAFLHCTNRMNRELKDAYFELIAENQSGSGSIESQVNLTLLNARRELFQNTAYNILTKDGASSYIRGDFASFLHHQENTLGGELGLGTQKSSSRDSNYKAYGGSAEQGQKLKERFLASYPRVIFEKIKEELRSPSSSLTQEMIYDWYKERYKEEDVQSFLLDSSGNISNDALMHYLVQTGHLESVIEGDHSGISAKQNFVHILLELEDIEGFKKAIKSPNFDFKEIPDQQIPLIAQGLCGNKAFIEAMADFISQDNSEKAKDLKAFMLRVIREASKRTSGSQRDEYKALLQSIKDKNIPNVSSFVRI